jgi:hypothetical protein
MNAIKVRWPLIHWSMLFLIFAIIPSSCTSTTGTRIQMNQASLSKVRTLGIVIKQQEDFSVRMSRDRTTNTGAAFFGLVGVGVENAVRASNDSEHTQRLKSGIERFDPSKKLGESLKARLEASRQFDNVEYLSAEKEDANKSASYDAILEVTLGEWGLRLCIGYGEADRGRLQAALELSSRLFPTKDAGASIWERNEIHMEGTCHVMEELKSEERLLKALSRAVDRAAGRTANEILFP